MDKEKENLFEEFPPTTPGEWKEQIEKDLKGNSFEKIKWTPYEGFTVEPFYTREDLDNLSYLTEQAPGAYPFARGLSPQSNEWIITEYVKEDSADKANNSALEAIRMGAQSITFACNDKGVMKLNSSDDMATLLKSIDIDTIPIHFECGSAGKEILQFFLNEAETTGVKLDSLKGSTDIDPIGELILSGNPNTSFDELKSVLSEMSEKTPGLKGLTVHGEIFGDSGATAVQELAFSLASGVEYIDKLTSLDLAADQVAGHMSFSFSTGSDYFMEIAKLRAARHLWALIAEKYGADEEKSAMTIKSVSSGWNRTVYEPYTNMLRGTVSAMAASIGGSSSINVAPLDAAYEKSDEFTKRMARNTQLLLKNESYIDRVADPSAGSYYIENLTDMMARASWALFLEIEEKGGLIEALKSGFVQDSIEETRKSKDKNLAIGKDTILGVNKYPNLKETAPGVVGTKTRVEPSTDSGITPLKPYRAAEVFEKLRLSGERFGGNKSVFLLPIGNPAMRTARAGFSANFFGCGGFTVIDQGAFDDLELGLQSAINSSAKIVVICSSDKEYPELAPGICEKLNSKSSEIKIIVAGNPKDHIDELKNAGVDDFVHVRSNLLEILSKYQKAVGIE